MRCLFIIVLIFFAGNIAGILVQETILPWFFSASIFENLGLLQKVNNGTMVIEKTEYIRIEENKALVEQISKVQKSTRYILLKNKSGSILKGQSGFSLTNDGQILTLISSAFPYPNYFLLSEEGEISLAEIKRDKTAGLLLLKAKNPNFHTTALAELSRLKMGETVFLVTFLNQQDNIPTQIVNTGILVGFENNEILTNIREDSPLIFGSPLFNMEGELIGINKLDSNNRVRAVDIEKIRQFLR